MVQIYKISSSGPVRLEEVQEGCWVNLVAPTEEEMFRIHQELNIPLDFLRDALDQEERAHIDNEDGVTQIVVDVPVLEVEGKAFLYTTMPLGIIHTDDIILTICLQECSLIMDFIDGRVRNVETSFKSRFIFQLLYRNATRFLMYLRQIDKASDSLNLELQKSYRNKELLQMMALEKSLVYFSTSLKSNEVVLEKLVKVNYIKKYSDDTDLLEDAITENRQAIEMCSIYSDILSGMMDAYASIISNNLNIVMKFLASMTIVVSVPTMVTGLWGANVNVPWQNSPFGFWAVLGLALGATGIAIFFLWKKRMF